MCSTSSADGPRVLDASVVLNLLAIEQDVAKQILSAHDARFMVAARVIDREVLEDPRDRDRPARPRFDALAAGGTIDIVALGEPSIARFVDLAFDMDDGEAATIALAEHVDGIAVLDDGSARKVAGLYQQRLEWTVDVLLHGTVVTALGQNVLAAAVYDALRLGRMRVPEHILRKVIGLVGIDRARECPSLPRRALDRFSVSNS